MLEMPDEGCGEMDGAAVLRVDEVDMPLDLLGHLPFGQPGNQGLLGRWQPTLFRLLLVGAARQSRRACCARAGRARRT